MTARRGITRAPGPFYALPLEASLRAFASGWLINLGGLVLMALVC